MTLLGQVRGVIGTPLNIYEGTFYKTNNVNLRLPSIWDACLGQECSSVDGYNTVLKINMEMSPWHQVKMVSFSAAVFIWNLGQLIVLAQGDH